MRVTEAAMMLGGVLFSRIETVSLSDVRHRQIELAIAIEIAHRD